MGIGHESALVVFSGGQDSTTCLAWAKATFEKVVALTFDYGQRHDTEIAAAKNLAQRFGVEHHILDMSLLGQITNNALTNLSMEVEAGGPGELPSTFVEGRNMLFLAFAGVFAKVRSIHHIVVGVCETDFSGYPDCRDIFVKSMQVTMDLAMEHQFVIHTPLMWLTKAQTWALADDLGHLSTIRDCTVTCYNGVIGKGCGSCPACELRARGYEQYMEVQRAQNY